MKPLNKKQRNKAFVIYLILFVFVNAIVVGIVFFNYQVPGKENKFLQKKLDYLSLKSDEQENFAKEMDKVKSLLDTMDIDGINREYVDQLISTDLAYMRTNYAAKDSTFLGGMYNNIILTYLDLKIAKSQLKELDEAKSDIDTYVETIDKLKEQLKEVQRDLDVCRSMHR